MQPYFIPYLGYFSLLKNTYKFILLDNVQFIRHHWIERNRILKPGDGWQYVKVPLMKHSRNTLIKDIKIRIDQDWRDLIFRQIEHYRKNSPYYNDTIILLKEAFDIKTDSIVELNENILKTISEYIGFNVELDIFSEMDLDIQSPEEPDDWALYICQSLDGVDEYWNPVGGLSLFNKEKYESSNIDIKFFKFNINKYSQKREGFEPGLSIIDVLMFNEPKTINKMLDDFSII